jgi:hypothetical protein
MHPPEAFLRHIGLFQKAVEIGVIGVENTAVSDLSHI